MGEVAAPVQAVQAPAPQTAVQNAFHLQRKCACGSYGTGGGQCDKCREEGAKLQRTAARSQTDLAEACDTPDGLPEIVHHVLHSSGQPLDRATRAWLEPRFGHDFSNVRVHTDARAAESAHAVNALAYTVGDNVVFGPGQYAPSTERGNRLLAHELTHVVQQSRGSSAQQAKAISEPSDAAEVEADAMANRVMNSGGPVAVTQAPTATLHALTDGETAGAIAGSIVGAGLLSVGIAWLAGAFDKERFSDTELTAYLTFLATNRHIEDHRDSDNKARDVVRRWRENETAYNIDNGYSSNSGNLSAVDLKRLLIQEMLSGVTAGADENAILTILENSSTEQIVELLDPTHGVSVQNIDDKVGGENHDRFERLLEARLPRTGPNAAPQRRQTTSTCTARQALMVDYARQRAVEVVNDAISALTTRASDSDVAGALNCWFPSATPAQVNEIRGVLERVRTTLPSRVYTCGGEGGQAELAGMTFTGPQGQQVPVECINEYATSFGVRSDTGENTMFNDVFLCGQFFRQQPEGQVITLIHESVHATGITTDPNYNPSCGLSIATALTNPDSYAYLAANLAQVQRQRSSQTGQSGQAGQSGQSGQVQRKASDNSTLSELPEEVNEVLHSPGQSLDQATRVFMENRFDRSFSDVRLHTDSAAAQSARAIKAHAYTAGEDVVFGSGQYQPRTQQGTALLAHELTHVVQQQNHTVTTQQTAKPVSEPSDAAEVEAESVAADVLSGGPVQVQQTPSATVHALNEGETAGVVAGVIGGLGLAGLGIAAALGAFEKAKFSDCKGDQPDKLTAGLKVARKWVDDALAAVDKVIAGPKAEDDWILELLRKHFKIAAKDKGPLGELREGLSAIQSNLDKALFQCTTDCDETATSYRAGRTHSLIGPYLAYGRIEICTIILQQGHEDELAETIVHEMGHRYAGKNPSVEVYRKSDSNYFALPTETALSNADSFAQFSKDVSKIGGRKAENAKENKEGAEKTEGGAVKRKAIGAGEPAAVPQSVHEVLHSPGEPLAEETRRWMEPRFGHDFGDVKVHSDAHAAESARDVSAAAYTVGQDVVFGAGRYEPETRAGRELLAHELTHVVQQRGQSESESLTIGNDGEHEADRVGGQIANGAYLLDSVQNSSHAIHRQAGPESQPASEPEAKPEAQTTPQPQAQPEQTGGIPVVDETSGMRGYPPSGQCIDFLWAREYQRTLRLDTISVVALSAKAASDKKEDVRAARQKNDDLKQGLIDTCPEFIRATHPFRVRFYYLDTDLRTTERTQVNTDDAKKNRALGDSLGASQSPRIRVFVERESELDEDFKDAQTLTAKLKKIIEKSSQSAAKRGAKTGLVVGSILGGLTAIGVGIGVGAAVRGAGGDWGKAIGLGALVGGVAGGVVLGISSALGALFGEIGGTDRGTKELSKDRIKEVIAFVTLLRKTGEVKGDKLTSNDADDLARDAVTLWIDNPSTLPLTVKDRRLLIKVMLDGATFDDDERAIIKLFENSTDAEVLQVLDPTADAKERVTIQMLDDKINGAEWKEFRQSLQARFPSLGAPKIQRTETSEEHACEADHSILITQALKRATEVVPIVQQRIGDYLAAPEKQQEVLSKIQCYFPGAARADVEKIKGMFDSIQQLIPSSRYVCLGKGAISQTPRGPRQLECEGSGDIAQTIPFYEPDMKTIKSAMPETYLCPSFFKQGPIYQATTLIHEWVHRVIPASETDKYEPKCGDLKLAVALENPDSYALLARDLAEGRSATPGQPSVTIGNFRNTGSPTPENRCVSCTQIPTLGLDPMTGGNFMEVRGDITGHRPDALYDFKRTKEVAIWTQMNDGTWNLRNYEGPGTLDDASADDEDTVPKFNQIYSIDGPGVHVPLPSIGDDTIKAGVYKGSFVESVNVKVGNGPWSQASNQFAWHSLTWFERGNDNLLRRTTKNNEIAPGAITVGNSPPQP